MAGDDAIAEEELAVEPEIRGAVRDERIQFHEAARVQEEVQALARGQLAEGVLALDSHGASALQGLGAHPPQLLKPLFAARHVDLLNLAAGDEGAGGAVFAHRQAGAERAP